MKIYRVYSANYAKKKGGRLLQRTCGITKLFTNWKKETQKMKFHSKVEVHLLSCQLDLKLIELEKKDPLSTSFKDFKMGRRLKLAHQHIAHTTNFDKLVELVVSCGGEYLQTFLDRAGRSATYTSKIAVVEFVNALGTGWKSV